LTVAKISFSQDTLVTDKGFLIPGNIVSQDNDFIAYSSLDTSVKELALIARSNVIFIKYQNGKTEQIFANDTLITKDGVFIFGKVIEIEPSSIIYFSYNGRVNPPTVLIRSDLLLIKLHDGTKELGSQQSVTIGSSLVSLSASEFTNFNMGVSDAKKYYKAEPKLLVAEVLFGLTSIFLGVPIAAATIICYAPPKKLNNSTNPNDALLNSNPAYKTGFVSEAKKKKRRAATTAYFSGLGTFVAGVFLLFVFYI
jgi:hypothetical protein